MEILSQSFQQKLTESTPTGLASFLLVRAFMDEVVAIHETDATSTSNPDVVVFDSIDVAQPELFVGGCLGAAVFLFASMAIMQ